MGKEKLFPDYIFESSWEVCNKVGGIYTVLSTRAKTLKEKLQDTRRDGQDFPVYAVLVGTDGICDRENSASGHNAPSDEAERDRCERPHEDHKGNRYKWKCKAEEHQSAANKEERDQAVLDEDHAVEQPVPVQTLPEYCDQDKADDTVNQRQKKYA